MSPASVWISLSTVVLLLTRAADVRKYLPPSDAGFALMQNFSAAVSGSTAEGQR